MPPLPAQMGTPPWGLAGEARIRRWADARPLDPPSSGCDPPRPARRGWPFWGCWAWGSRWCRCHPARSGPGGLFRGAWTCRCPGRVWARHGPTPRYCASAGAPPVWPWCQGAEAGGGGGWGMGMERRGRRRKGRRRRKRRSRPAGAGFGRGHFGRGWRKGGAGL